MKKLLIVLMFVCGSANADQWLESKNKQGGDIILTSYPSKDCEDYQRRMYATLPDGDVFYGCWAYLNEKFHVRMDDGRRHVYGLEEWKLKGEK